MTDARQRFMEARAAVRADAERWGGRSPDEMIATVLADGSLNGPIGEFFEKEADLRDTRGTDRDEHTRLRLSAIRAETERARRLKEQEDRKTGYDAVLGEYRDAAVAWAESMLGDGR